MKELQQVDERARLRKAVVATALVAGSLGVTGCSVFDAPADQSITAEQYVKDTLDGKQPAAKEILTAYPPRAMQLVDPTNKTSADLLVQAAKKELFSEAAEGNVYGKGAYATRLCSEALANNLLPKNDYKPLSQNYQDEASLVSLLEYDGPKGLAVAQQRIDLCGSVLFAALTAGKQVIFYE